ARLGQNHRKHLGVIAMRMIKASVTGLLVLLAAAPGFSQDAAPDAQRQTFNQEICQADGLDAAECDCAWTYVSGKMAARDLRLAMLLLASNSNDAATARRADEQLDKSNTTDRRRDNLAQEIGALIIEAQDS